MRGNSERCFFSLTIYKMDVFDRPTIHFHTPQISTKSVTLEEFKRMVHKLGGAKCDVEQVYRDVLHGSPRSVYETAAAYATKANVEKCNAPGARAPGRGRRSWAPPSMGAYERRENGYERDAL